MGGLSQPLCQIRVVSSERALFRSRWMEAIQEFLLKDFRVGRSYTEAFEYSHQSDEGVRSRPLLLRLIGSGDSGRGEQLETVLFGKQKVVLYREAKLPVDEA